jgi:hypothetical protein
MEWLSKNLFLQIHNPLIIPSSDTGSHQTKRTESLQHMEFPVFLGDQILQFIIHCHLIIRGIDEWRLLGCYAVWLL